MSSFILLVILTALIAGLGALLVLAQRQYEPGQEDDERRAGPPVSSDRGPVRTRDGAGGLSGLVASTIATATQSPPRNTAEADAVSALRSALARAIDGEFGAEVRAAIERLRAVESLHDVRPTIRTDDPLEWLLRGPEIEHLAVAGRGVTVIATRARSEGVDREPSFAEPGTDRYRGAMVDDMLRQMAAVSAVVAPIPVHGLVVLRDVLSLPAEIRSTAVDVQGVRLATLDQLPSVLTEPGPVADTAIVMARLRDGFEPALPPADDELRLSGRS